jgi:N-acetylglutamate synthase-like GNAT family acetyltransferase
MLIRKAETSDIPNIIDLICKVAETETAFNWVKPDKQRIFETLVNECHFVSIAEVESSIVGIFMISVRTSWFSEQLLASEVLWYVLPEYRGSKIGLKLLDSAVEYVKINKLPFQLSLFTEEDIDRKIKVLERKGFKKVGFVGFMN